MTTAADLVAEAERYLYAGSYDPMNTLNGSHDTSTTTISFNHELGALIAGTYIAVNLEVMYVVATDTSAKTATVIRAQLGSTAGTHATGDVVTVNPKFPKFAILAAINADLDDLSSPSNGLFAVDTVDITYSAAVQGYNLTNVTNVLEVLDAHYDDPGSAKAWPRVRYRLQRNSVTSDFASGFALQVLDRAHSGATIRVTYAKPFTHLAALSDNVTTTGLPTTAYDIPPLGAALRLELVREAQRNFNDSQGDTRRAAEVGAGAQLNSARGPAQLRAVRIAAERDRLRKLYPQRRRI